MKVNFYDYNNNKYVEFEQNDLLNKKNVVFESIVKKGKNKPKKDQIKKDLANYIKDEEILNEIMELSRSELLDMFYDSEVHKKTKGKDGKTKVEYLWSFDEEKIDNWIDEKIPVVYAEEEEEEEEEEEKPKEAIEDEDEDWFIDNKKKKSKEDKEDKQTKNDDKSEEKPKEEKPKEEKSKKKDIKADIKKDVPESVFVNDLTDDVDHRYDRYNKYFPVEQKALYIFLKTKLNKKTGKKVKQAEISGDGGSLFELLDDLGKFNKGDVFWIGNKEQSFIFTEKVLLEEFGKRALMRWADNETEYTAKQDIDSINDWEDIYNVFDFRNEYYYYLRNIVNNLAEQPSETGRFINKLVELAYYNIDKIGDGISRDFFHLNKNDNQIFYIAPQIDRRGIFKTIINKIDDDLIDRSTELLKQSVAKMLQGNNVSKLTLSQAFTKMYGKEWYKNIHDPSDELKSEIEYKSKDDYFKDLSYEIDKKFNKEKWVKTYIRKEGGDEEVFDWYSTNITDNRSKPINITIGKEKLYIVRLDMYAFEETGIDGFIKDKLNNGRTVY